MRFSCIIPKIPNDGYGVLWSSKSGDAIDTSSCHLITAHPDPGAFVGTAYVGEHVYLEVRDKHDKVVLWKKLNVRRLDAPSSKEPARE